MFFRQFVPNAITSLNLMCGCMGIVFALTENMLWSTWMIGIAAVLDFFDGFAARLLKGQSEIGKQLDSLADVVTFGVLPGVLSYQYITIGFHEYFIPIDERSLGHILLACCGFLIPVFSALRLARVNVSVKVTVYFQGVPTPANALFFASFALILDFQHDLNFYFSPQGNDYLNLALNARWDTFDAFVINTLCSPWIHIGAALISSF
ncbi:MAG: CDP-alcohol phosphatidyltransferase family protein [Salibacteraceae bacterium]